MTIFTANVEENGGGKWLILDGKKVGDLVPVSPTFLTMFIFLCKTLFGNDTNVQFTSQAYSTVTDLAKFLGLSTSQPLATDR